MKHPKEVFWLREGNRLALLADVAQASGDLSESIRLNRSAQRAYTRAEMIAEQEQEFDPENIYNLPSIRQSIEEDRK